MTVDELFGFILKHGSVDLNALSPNADAEIRFGHFKIFPSHNDQGSINGLRMFYKGSPWDAHTTSRPELIANFFSQVGEHKIKLTTERIRSEVMFKEIEYGRE